MSFVSFSQLIQFNCSSSLFSLSTKCGLRTKNTPYFRVSFSSKFCLIMSGIRASTSFYRFALVYVEISGCFSDFRVVSRKRLTANVNIDMLTDSCRCFKHSALFLNRSTFIYICACFWRWLFFICFLCFYVLLLALIWLHMPRKAWLWWRNAESTP